MKMRSLKMIFFILLFIASPCFAKDRPINPEAEVRTLVEEKTRLNTPESKDLSDLFKKPLGLDDAIGLALDRNLELKAQLGQVQLSVAEMKQIGLIESPQLGLITRFPVASPGSRVAYDLQLTQNVMDLLQRSIRKKIGLSNYESKKWEATSQILQTLAEVKATYFRYQGALQLRSFWQNNLAAAQAAGALAQEQRKAGNISELDEAQNLALLKMAQLESNKSLYEAKQARVSLAKLVGLPVESDWKLKGQLPQLPGKDPKLEELQRWAQENRPDLIAQKYTIASKQSGVILAKKAVLPRLDVGVSAEWDAEGNKGIGPVVSFGMPFLGHRKAGIAKAEAELNVSQKSIAATQQIISYDLEEIYQQLTLARQTVRFYQNEIIPVQKRILTESLKHYNYMLLGNYQLLQAKQNQLNAERDSIQALRDYWVAYAELEHLTGASFEKIETSNSKSSSEELKR